MNIRRALISVWDKTGVVEFARALHGEFGVEIISTGGTAKALREADIPVTLVETLTGCGEMLDGRVKTLHPAIHAAILADRDNPDHMRQLEAAGILPIDLVVVNLYPFERTVADPARTLEQAIEMIDIGGVALLRAAAKNHKHVLTPTTGADCDAIIKWLRGEELSDEGWAQVRRDLATSALLATSRYDARITEYLSHHQQRAIHACVEALRYGENPQQSGWGGTLAETALPTADDARPRKDWQPRPLTWADWGLSTGNATALSYNNYLDADAALGLCAELARASKPAQPALRTASHSCVFVKHTNACGAAVHTDRIEAYRKAYLGDPNAAMGGILAVDFAVDAGFAAVVMETYARYGKPLRKAGASHAPGGFFVEVWIAPRFTEDAVAVIRGTYDPATAKPEAGEPRLGAAGAPAAPRKDWGQRVRLLAVGDMAAARDTNAVDYRSIAGGMLVQTPDALGLNEEQWTVVTNRAPTEAELADLRLAWLVCKHTKSNAISLVKDGMLLGNGAGQMSRVMSCRIATWLARENGHEGGPVAASDAFFPFPDGPRVLLDAGVTALIQPGGGKRDLETIELCNQRGVAMIFTGTRHFRH